jgi:hypothetical protein
VFVGVQSPITSIHFHVGEELKHIFSTQKFFPLTFSWKVAPLVPRNPMQMVPMAWNQGQEEEQLAEKLPAGALGEMLVLGNQSLLF